MPWKEIIAGFGVLMSAAGAFLRIFDILPSAVASSIGVVGMGCFLGGTTLTIKAISDKLGPLEGGLSSLLTVIGAPTIELPDKRAAISHQATILAEAKFTIRQLAPAKNVKRPDKLRDQFEDAVDKACKRGIKFNYVGDFSDAIRVDRVKRLRKSGIASEMFESRHVLFPQDVQHAAISLLIIDDRKAVFIIPRSGADKSFLATSNAVLIRALIAYFDRIWDSMAVPWEPTESGDDKTPSRKAS